MTRISLGSAKSIPLKPSSAERPWPLILATVFVAAIGLASPRSLFLLLPALFAFYKIRSNRWARVARSTEVAVLGRDGCQLPSRFVSWNDVVAIKAHGDGAAFLSADGGLIKVRPMDTLDFIELASGLRRAFVSRTPVRLPELEWRQGESQDEREARLERLYSEGDYRGEGAADPSRLVDLVADPAAPGAKRLTAARLLVRVQPQSAGAVAQAAKETAQTVVRESLELLVR